MKVLAAVVVTALLAGAATATAQSLITSADIANNTIRGKDVRQRTLTLRDLKRSTIAALRGQRGPAGPRGPRGFQGPRGPAGSTGATGAPGPRSLTNVTFHDGAPVSVAPGEAEVATAACPSGRIPVSASTSDSSSLELDLEDLSIGVSGAFVLAVNNASAVDETLQARVACALR